MDHSNNVEGHVLSDSRDTNGPDDQHKGNSVVEASKSAPDPLDNPVFMVGQALEKRLRNLLKRQQKFLESKSKLENTTAIQNEGIGHLGTNIYNSVICRSQSKTNVDSSKMPVKEEDYFSKLKTIDIKMAEIKTQIEFIEELTKINQKQLKEYVRAARRRDYAQNMAKNPDCITPSISEDDRSSPVDSKIGSNDFAH